ncbi:HNH endonuclease [Dyadobacter sp. CY356]|uniref:HNH endonuclease n=1 Tax=Dyadobacter sp. CY356 TaxID=2906442 RepID=UPI001F241FBD|nr:HNH endonuclease [Dyadobacter sp. CY356]MCF0057170.1 hypothetical protein [Dyadobacter sp. CY356]
MPVIENTPLTQYKVPICYLCGLEMIDKNQYERVSEKNTDSTKFKHDEHIIQNALYGRLKSDGILCETCGSKLSQAVDSEFVKIFDVFTDPINHLLAAKAHGGKTKKSLRGHIIKHDGSKMEIQLRDGKILPLKPSYDYDKEKKVVSIFADLKTQKNYLVLVKRQLIGLGADLSKVKFEFIDNIKDYYEIGINFSEGLTNFNETFKLGLNKIATGFAMAAGINREDVPCTLDITEQAIIFTKNIVPFFPLGTLDYVIEPFRIALEDEFPTHTLLLYTDDSFEDRKLVCYVDLFSTFQYYVILNHEYKGAPINKVYYQTIMKQDKSETNVRNIRWKYLPILAADLGVDWGDIQHLPISEMYDLLEKKEKQTNPSYILDFSAYMKYISSRVALNLVLRKKDKASGVMQLSEIESDILASMSDFETEELLEMHLEMKRIDSEDPVSFYRQNYFESHEGKVTLNSSLEELIRCMHDQKFGGFKKYGHAKFNLLSHFIQINKS